MLAISTGHDDAETGRDREEAGAEVADDRVRDHDSEPDADDRAGRSEQQRGAKVDRRIWRRVPPIAFIIPISRRCSPISVVIVFAISTSAESSASTVNTFISDEIWLKKSLPG